MATVTGLGAVAVYEEQPGAAPRGFFRVRPDGVVYSDADLLSDYEEWLFGSDRFAADGESPPDGILDHDEFRYGLDPMADDSAPGGALVVYDYDAAGRLIGASGLMAHQYAPDAEGNLQEAQ